MGALVSAATLRLTRVLRFEAAHRLYTAQLSDAENERIYGKCARLGGHGHNYEVEVCLQGDLPEGEAFLVDRSWFDQIVRARLLERVDHRNLDDVLAGVVTTGENLARTFFSWLAPSFPGPVRLQRIRVRETRSNLFEATYAEKY